VLTAVVVDDDDRNLERQVWFAQVRLSLC
jgi:hypothetical protein